MTYFHTTYYLLPASCWGGVVAFGGLKHIMVYERERGVETSPVCPRRREWPLTEFILNSNIFKKKIKLSKGGGGEKDVFTLRAFIHIDRTYWDERPPIHHEFEPVSPYFLSYLYRRVICKKKIKIKKNV